MPRATSTSETTRVELATCPGGFVELRKFTYGEMIKRRELSTSMSAPMKDGKNPEKMDLGLNLTASGLYEFKTAVVDHNLEDENGAKLNFKNANDVLRLDPLVAQEIEVAIDQMNQLPEDVVRPLPEESTTPSPAKLQQVKSSS